MSTTAVRKYPDQLPATPCTTDMRAGILELAKARGVSLAEIQREALTLFLSENYSIAIENNRRDMEAEPEQA